MKKIIFILLLSVFTIGNANAQLAKVYDESLDPMGQIDKAINKAKESSKFVICQVGGNWCKWCLRFADFIKQDSDIADVISENFVYEHVNYPRKGAAEILLKRLGNPGRFGYPVFVVLDEKGTVVHIQDSSFLEDGGEGYDKTKVLRFLNSWTPKAVKGN